MFGEEVWLMMPDVGVDLADLVQVVGLRRGPRSRRDSNLLEGLMGDDILMRVLGDDEELVTLK